MPYTFLGNGIFLCTYFALVEEQELMCNAGGMPDSLGLHEVIQDLYKEQVLVLHLVPHVPMNCFYIGLKFPIV